MAKIQSTPRDRVSFETDKHFIFKDLAEAKDGPFATMKDVFMLAACVGYEMGYGTSLKAKQGVFDWSVFSEEDDIPVLRALAISKEKDLGCLIDRDQLLDVAEEYANTGIDVLRQEILDPPGTLTNKMVSFYLKRME